MKAVRGVLLDIYGTRVESNDAHAHAWVRALAESGRAVSFGTVRPLIGMGGAKLLPAVCGVDAESREGKRIRVRRSDARGRGRKSRAVFRESLVAAPRDPA